MQLRICGTVASGSVAIWLALMSSTWAAGYSVRFGEFQPPDSKLLTPTNTIKLCERSTGYRYGLEIVPQGSEAYDFSWKMTLPAPPATLSYQGKIGSTEHGQVITSEPFHAQGRASYAFWIDKGDPTGTYRLEVSANNTLVGTIDYQIVAAAHCP
jgi:hypothetical protein